MTARFDVICLGEVLWDIFEADERAGQPMARTLRCELGGSPANVAAGLARLGFTTAIVGGVGRDRLGLTLKRLLETEGVSTDFLVEFPNRTGLTFVTRDARGEPEFLPYRHDSADLAITAAHVTPATGRTRWALVGSNSLLTPSLARATTRFVEVVRASGGLLCVDLNVRTHLWPDHDEMRAVVTPLLQYAHLVKASEADLAALAGSPGEEWLEQNRRNATWILTHGDRSADAVGDHGRATMPAYTVKTVDATGAGDAFVAGVLGVLVAAGAQPGSESWQDERLWMRALAAGHMMGAKAVGSVGAITGLTDLDEVRAIIAGLARS